MRPFGAHCAHYKGIDAYVSRVRGSPSVANKGTYSTPHDGHTLAIQSSGITYRWTRSLAPCNSEVRHIHGPFLTSAPSVLLQCCAHSSSEVGTIEKLCPFCVVPGVCETGRKTAAASFACVAAQSRRRDRGPRVPSQMDVFFLLTSFVLTSVEAFTV